MTPVCQDVQDCYTLRVLRLKLLRIQGDQLVDDQDCPERDVLHFHYTSWPDHGTPETAGQLLAFIQKSSQSSRDTDGPIVVHCRWVLGVPNSSIASIDCKTNDLVFIEKRFLIFFSAGVGRTGAYIVIDAMLRQMQSIGKLDIDGYLGYIRHQRNYLIQTIDQYVFVHDVLLEAVSRRMVVQPPPELFSPSASMAASFSAVASDPAASSRAAASSQRNGGNGSINH